MPRILYRADGGHPVGTGHIQRALRITSQLITIKPDTKVVLVTRDNQYVRRAVAESGIAALEAEFLEPAPLGVKPMLDARELEDIARQMQPDILVVDMLDTQADEMERLRGFAPTLVTLDDRGPGRLFADLICNFLVRDPNPSELDAKRTWLREGPEYASLGPEFIAVKRNHEELERVRRVMVTMGGADAAGLTVKVAEDLLLLKELEVVDFIIGAAFVNAAQLQSVVVHASWKANIHLAAPSLLSFYENADLAIVAGGITMHEVACCGVPAIAVCQPVDHQLLVATALDQAGCILNLGYGAEIRKGAIAAAVQELSANPLRRKAMSAAGPKVCDGLGSLRVAKLILARWREQKNTSTRHCQ